MFFQSNICILLMHPLQFSLTLGISLACQVRTLSIKIVSHQVSILSVFSAIQEISVYIKNTARQCQSKSLEAMQLLQALTCRLIWRQAPLQVLQISRNQMFMLRFKTLSAAQELCLNCP